MCKKNDCECDFSHGRCLFYQEEYILIYFKKIASNFASEIFIKYSKNAQNIQI